MNAFKHLVQSTPAPGISLIQLNRPHKANALNGRLITELTTLLEKLKHDSNNNIIIIENIGKVFCAGVDLFWLMDRDGHMESKACMLKDLFLNLYHHPKVIIANAQGNAYGGGLGLLACCDFVWAHTSTQLCCTEIKIGLVPAIISPFIIEKIGTSASQKLFMLGNNLSTQKSIELGLVNKETNEHIDSNINNTLKAFFNHQNWAGLASIKQLSRSNSTIHAVGFDHLTKTLCQSTSSTTFQAFFTKLKQKADHEHHH